MGYNSRLKRKKKNKRIFNKVLTIYISKNEHCSMEEASKKAESFKFTESDLECLLDIIYEAKYLNNKNVEMPCDDIDDTVDIDYPCDQLDDDLYEDDELEYDYNIKRHGKVAKLIIEHLENQNRRKKVAVYNSFNCKMFPTITIDPYE